MTKQVLGTTTAAPEPIEENMRVDHNETSITYPKIYKMEKVTNNKAEYVKLTNDNKVVVIEKDTSTPKQIEKDLDCTNKPNCKKAVKGANTYTNIQTEDTDAYMAARDNEFVVIKFVNVDTPTKDIILTSKF